MLLQLSKSNNSPIPRSPSHIFSQFSAETSRAVATDVKRVTTSRIFLSSFFSPLPKGTGLPTLTPHRPGNFRPPSHESPLAAFHRSSPLPPNFPSPFNKSLHVTYPGSAVIHHQAQSVPQLSRSLHLTVVDGQTERSPAASHCRCSLLLLRLQRSQSVSTNHLILFPSRPLLSNLLLAARHNNRESFQRSRLVRSAK